jgi:WD40 repeat protein
MYVIHDAHNYGVTALSTTRDCSRIVSGGQEGEVRVWKISQLSQSMIASMKQHQGSVNDIIVRF